MPRDNVSRGIDTRSVVNRLTICDNITDTAIRITESKARLVYRDHVKCPYGERLVASIGLFITFLTTLLTSNFKNIFNIENSKYILSALFILAAIVTGISTIYFLVRWIISFKDNNEEAFITALKGYDIS